MLYTFRNCLIWSLITLLYVSLLHCLSLYAGLYVVKNKPKKEWKYDPEPVVMEETNWLARKEFQLDRYNCHLNAVVS